MKTDATNAIEKKVRRPETNRDGAQTFFKVRETSEKDRCKNPSLSYCKVIHHAE